VDVLALRALKRADIETHTCRHDPNEHHVIAALWASRAMDVKVDVVRQEIGFLHDDSLLEKAGVAANKNNGRSNLTLARSIGLGASSLSLWTAGDH
jgi:hypothetical protein